MTKIFGHRGAAGTFPENTMISFQEAERVGVEGIEIDVQLTQDEEVVIIHDETVNRTTNGKGWVKDFTLKQIRQLEASYKFPNCVPCKIPSLEELFSWSLSNSLLINVELKNTKISYVGLEEKVINLIRKYHLEDRVILSSFNHYSLVKCYQLAPEISIAVLYSDGLYEPWVYAKWLKAVAIHPHYKAAPSQVITLSQENGVKVRPYTVNDTMVMEELFSIDCAAFITDYPEKALALRNKYKKNRPS